MRPSSGQNGFREVGEANVVRPPTRTSTSSRGLGDLHFPSGSRTRVAGSRRAGRGPWRRASATGTYVELLARARRTQEQAAPAHVAATDELRGKPQPRRRTRRAARRTYLSVAIAPSSTTEAPSDPVAQPSGVAHERPAVAGLRRRDGDAREAPEIAMAHGSSGASSPAHDVMTNEAAGAKRRAYASLPRK